MQPWQAVWRNGVIGLASRESLTALREALVNDDPRLIQCATVKPFPWTANHGKRACGACVLGFLGIADGLETVQEVDEFVGRMCLEIDSRIGEQGGCRYLMVWWDTTDLYFVKRDLVPEIDLALAQEV